MTTKEKLKEVDLSNNPQEPRPILIITRLTKGEKKSLVQLLKEFKDVFMWEYSQMPRLDLNMVMHKLNVEFGPKTVAQPARLLHTGIKAQIVQEVQKLLAT